MNRASAACVLVAAAVLVPAAASASGATRLTIDVWPHGRTVATGHGHYVLSCMPARGTVPHPGRACLTMRTLQAPFAPTPKTAICPALVLGPQEAHVVGLVHGKRVDAWLNLAGCGVARWQRVRAVVPIPLAGTTPP